MKKIIYKTETGVAVIHPTSSVESALKDVPEGAEYKIVEDSEIPADRTFRNAWTFDLKEDIEKSKEIWKTKLRKDRAPLLSELDVEYQRADESGDAKRKSEIAAEKQKLRDVTKLVDNCKTIEDIKKIKIQG